MRHPPGRQLPLNIKLRDDATFDNYVGNDRAVEFLRSQLQGVSSSLRFIYIWGRCSTGRTHLLQASCHGAGQLGYSSAYLPVSPRKRMDAAVMVGLAGQDLVCFDDMDGIERQAGWEEALFHFLNEAKDSDTRVLMSGLCPPAELNLDLADLKSRLTSALVLRIEPLSDVQKKAALKLRAGNRGIDLSEEVAGFILSRANRNMTSLFGLLDELDRENVHQQRKITIPFAKKVLRL